MNIHGYDLKREQWREVLRALKQIKEEGPTVHNGICANLEDRLRKYGNWHAYYLMPELCKAWPELNGNDRSYPVGTDTFDPCHSKWDLATPAGKRRWRLLNWLIKELQARV